MEAAVEVVAGLALPRDGVQLVVLVLVESVTRVWVQRKGGEVKVGRMMAGMTARLPPVRRPSVRFTEDDVMYCTVVEGEQPDDGVIVRYIDFGKDIGDCCMLHLTEKMARLPAAGYPRHRRPGEQGVGSGRQGGQGDQGGAKGRQGAGTLAMNTPPAEWPLPPFY